MKFILTGQKRSDAKRKWKVMVDDDDYEKLKHFSWHVDKYGCVKRHTSSGHELIYRKIMNAPDDKEVDHIDGNRLNNQKSNLRLANSSQNKCNRGPRRDNKSGYKGVSWHKQRNKWTARIQAGKKYLSLGLFTSKEEAAKAYNQAAITYQNDFAYLNPIA
jgi:hypothetical protein